MQHYGEAIEEIAKQVESANRFTANKLYNQDLKLGQANGISGTLHHPGVSSSMQDGSLPRLGKTDV